MVLTTYLKKVCHIITYLVLKHHRLLCRGHQIALDTQTNYIWQNCQIYQLVLQLILSDTPRNHFNKDTVHKCYVPSFSIVTIFHILTAKLIQTNFYTITVITTYNISGFFLYRGKMKHNAFGIKK